MGDDNGRGGREVGVGWAGMRWGCGDVGMWRLGYGWSGVGGMNVIYGGYLTVGQVQTAQTYNFGSSSP